MVRTMEFLGGDMRKGDAVSELLIKPGTKMQMAFDVPLGKTPDFNLIVTFQKAVDEAFFLVSVPMFAGKALILDENQKFLIQYGVGEERCIIAAYPETLEKKGVRTFWKMRQVTEQRTFVKHREERYKVSFPLSYMRDHVTAKSFEEAMSIDISAGGMSFFLNDYPDVDEAFQVRLPEMVVGDDVCEVPDQLGIVCWVREAPRGSLFRNVCGVQFRYADDFERDQVRCYIEHVRDKYKLQG